MRFKTCTHLLTLGRKKMQIKTTNSIIIAVSFAQPRTQQSIWGFFFHSSLTDKEREKIIVARHIELTVCVVVTWNIHYLRHTFDTKQNDATNKSMYEWMNEISIHLFVDALCVCVCRHRKAHWIRDGLSEKLRNNVMVSNVVRFGFGFGFQSTNKVIGFLKWVGQPIQMHLWFISHFTHCKRITSHWTIRQSNDNTTKLTYMRSLISCSTINWHFNKQSKHSTLAIILNDQCSDLLVNRFDHRKLIIHQFFVLFFSLFTTTQTTKLSLTMPVSLFKHLLASCWLKKGEERTNKTYMRQEFEKHVQMIHRFMVTECEDVNR